MPIFDDWQPFIFIIFAELDLATRDYDSYTPRQNKGGLRIFQIRLHGGDQPVQ